MPETSDFEASEFERLVSIAHEQQKVAEEKVDTNREYLGYTGQLPQRFPEQREQVSKPPEGMTREEIRQKSQLTEDEAKKAVNDYSHSFEAITTYLKESKPVLHVTYTPRDSSSEFTYGASLDLEGPSTENSQTALRVLNFIFCARNQPRIIRQGTCTTQVDNPMDIDKNLQFSVGYDDGGSHYFGFAPGSSRNIYDIAEAKQLTGSLQSVLDDIGSTVEEHYTSDKSQKSTGGLFGRIADMARSRLPS